MIVIDLSAFHRKRYLLLIVCIANLHFTGQSLAHPMLEHSSPANHATLSTPPKMIDLTFGTATKLTKLKLLSAGREIPLALDRSFKASTTFSIPLPALKPGSYQVKWSTLSGDGHAMTGNLSFTVSGH
jgi:methionine-rich copper-binding protein CopC